MKNTALGNFEKILEIFDENSIEKVNIYLFLGKVVAKNRAFENNIIFLHVFRFGGGGFETPHAYATIFNPKQQWTIIRHYV